MSEKRFESCIRVNGVPLLPPIITDEMRGEIKILKKRAILVEKKLAQRKQMLRTNRWAEIDCELGVFGSGREKSIIRTDASTNEGNMLSSSIQTEMNKTQDLETIRLNDPMRKQETRKKWNKNLCYSSPMRQKWTSCPDRLGSTNTLETLNIQPEEICVSETSSEEWKRWMSVPDVYDMTSSISSASSVDFFKKNLMNSTAKPEISPDRQKSYTLFKPSKYLVDYARRKAYEYCNTPQLNQRHKSYTVIEPSKFLLDYVKNKGYVGPVEDNPKISLPGRRNVSAVTLNLFYTEQSNCKKCKDEYCLCDEELPSSFPTEELKNRAATIINAAVRGFFVRRLMKTRKVQQCLDIIKFSVDIHFSLNRGPIEDYDEHDVELRLHIMRQLLSTCEEFYNIFFGMTRTEQFKIIAFDRQLMKEDP